MTTLSSTYYICVPVSYLTAHAQKVLVFYLAIMVGNFIGCNLYRWVAPTSIS